MLVKPILSAYINDYPEGGEVFTHKDEDGIFRTFAVCLMNRFAADYANKCDLIVKVKTPITAENVHHARTNMGIEQARLDRLADPWLHMPLMCIAWSFNKQKKLEVTCVDGNHRMVKLFEGGERFATNYIFHPDLWQEFLINIPDAQDRLTRPSGVIEHEQSKSFAS